VPREFELHKEIEIAATPEQVWEAIATGPGIDSWFMGPHQVEPGEGGKISLEIGDFSEQSSITAWDPPKRLAYRTSAAADGTFHAMEYLVEGRGQGSTVLRFVHNGILSDDWGAEYEDMTGYGWDLYFHTLAQYLTYFGRPGVYVHAEGPQAAEGQDAWTVLCAGLGVTEPLVQGDKVRLVPEGLPAIDGVVDFAVPGYRGLLGVRGSEGLYRFHGHGDRIGVGHHIFRRGESFAGRESFAEGTDPGEAGKAWQEWLNRVYG
jgi:uncharacterized protein YndB with AHSA1/START domain